jgi:hypothetical protein
LVQNAGQAQGKNGSDPLAPLLARKIRERLIRHGILHRVLEAGTESVSAHPGYVCRWGENGRERMGVGQIGKVTVSFKLPPFACYFQSGAIAWGSK